MAKWCKCLHCKTTCCCLGGSGVLLILLPTRLRAWAVQLVQFQANRNINVAPLNNWMIYMGNPIKSSINGWFMMENPMKIDNLGVPRFMETSMGKSSTPCLRVVSLSSSRQHWSCGVLYQVAPLQLHYLSTSVYLQTSLPNQSRIAQSLTALRKMIVVWQVSQQVTR